MKEGTDPAGKQHDDAGQERQTEVRGVIFGSIRRPLLPVVSGALLVAWASTAIAPSVSVPTPTIAGGRAVTPTALLATPTLAPAPSPTPFADARPPTGTASPVVGLKSPDSQEPASGICAQAEGPVAAVQIGADVPEPRCLRVRPDQRLRVTNSTSQPVQVKLAQIDATILPGQDLDVDQSFGAYLAPGVHILAVSAYGAAGPELWLER